MVLNGTQPLTIEGTTDAETIGANNKFNNLQIIGNVIASGGANLINIAGFNLLTVTGGSNFTDQGVTSSNIASIIIGDSNGNGGYLLKPVANFSLNTDNMKFGSQDSELGIEGNGTNITVTLNGSLDPGTLGNGKIGLNPGVGGSLTITGASSLGIQGQGGNLLNQIVPSGTGNVTITPDINTVNPLLTGLVGQLILGNVNTGINFAAATNLTVNNVTGTTDFKGQTGIVNINNNGIVGIVTSSIAGTPAGTVNFAGAGTSTAITNVTVVNFNGAGTVEITSPSGPSTFTVNNADAQVNTAASPAALTGTVAEGDGTVFAVIKGSASVNDGSITGSISGDATITGDGEITGNVDGNATVNSGELTGNTGGNASVGVDGQITGNIGGTATYTGAGTITATTIGSQTDLAGFAGVLNVNANGTVGNVISSNGVVGEAMLGDSVTTGDIINVATVNFAGAGTINVPLRGSKIPRL